MAIQTYPWNWVAIVDQEKDHHNGYYFGIDAQGRVGLQLSVWGTWETCVSQSRVPLMQWSYVVGTFDPQSGVRLYIDGKPAGECSVKGRSDPAKKTGLRIGRNFQDLPPTSLVRTSAAFPTYYSLRWDSRRTQDLQPDASGRGSRRHLSSQQNLPPHRS